MTSTVVTRMSMDMIGTFHRWVSDHYCS